MPAFAETNPRRGHAPGRITMPVQMLMWLLRPLVRALRFATSDADTVRDVPPRCCGCLVSRLEDPTMASRARRYWELEAKVRLGEALTPTERHAYADLLRRVLGGLA